MDGVIEEKIGKLWTKLTELLGKIQELERIILGNGIKGHDERIRDLEESRSQRRETCPFAREHASQKGQRIMIWGLIINALIMVSGFATVALSIAQRLP